MGSVKVWLGHQLRLALVPVGRWLAREQRREWEALAAYGGLVHQAFHAEPFRPWVGTDVVLEGAWRSPACLRPTESPARRERDNAVHHYGHDVVLKRAAGLPLVGRPLPFMLEHGVNFSEQASFEDPQPWVRSYLCMGPRRAARLQRRFGVRAAAVGPYLDYARPVVTPERLTQLRRQLGRTLLVIPVHSVVNVQRHWPVERVIALVAQHAREGGYDSVIWQGFWKDPPPSALPSSWLLACNGHPSNPWFLDCQRTLLELCDAMATFALGSHVGYALALHRPVWIAGVETEQDLAAAEPLWRDRYRHEWQERRQLLAQLGVGAGVEDFQALDPQQARALLDPYFGFDHGRRPADLARLLRGQAPSAKPSVRAKPWISKAVREQGRG